MKNKFGSLTRDEILEFFDELKDYFNTPRTPDIVNLNKLVMFFNYYHLEKATFDIVSEIYGRLPETTVRTALKHVVEAMERYFGDDWIVFPMDDTLKQKMVQILIDKGEPFPHALFIIDGKCIRYPGKSKKENMCWKFKFRGGINNMLIKERVFHTWCDLSMASGSTHDFRMFKESEVCKNLDLYIGRGYYGLADTAYFWSDEEYQKYICAVPSKKKHPYQYSLQSSEVWDLHRKVRGSIEHQFGIEYHNQWKGLNNFNGRGESGELRFKSVNKVLLSFSNWVRLHRLCKSDV